MEPIGATSESNWGSYGPSGSTEDSEIMALLFGNTPYSEVPIREQSLEMPPMYWSEHEMANPYYGSSDGQASFTYWSHGGNTNSCTNNLPSPHDIECYYLNDPATSSGGNGGGLVPMDFFLAAEEKSNASSPNGTENGLDGSPGDSTTNMLDAASPPRRKTTPKRMATTRELDDSHMPKEEKVPTASPKKKPRSTNDSINLNGKNLHARRTQKNINKNAELEENNCLTRDTSGNYSSEDVENASPDPEDCVENPAPKGTKTRASRGSATDPQSLYARKRRERINERLRILQNLVPNGTKVDISTMLEEAVEYVKFLQLQIKVLSSDELWMYAPIAYNGMNIGLDLKISPPQ